VNYEDDSGNHNIILLLGHPPAKLATAENVSCSCFVVPKMAYTCSLLALGSIKEERARGSGE